MLKTLYNRFSKWIMNAITSETCFLFLMFFFNLTYIGIYWVQYINGTMPLWQFPCYVIRYCAEMFFWIVVIICFLHSIPIGYKITRAAILLLSSILFPIEIFLLYNFQAVFGVSVFQLLIATNPREVKDFIDSYFTFEYLMGVFLSCCITLTGIYLMYRARNQLNAIICKHSQIIMCLFGVGALISGIYFVRDPAFMIGSCLSIQRITYSGYRAYDEMREYQKVYAESYHNPTVLENSSTIPYVVFILGESTNRNHMSLYGYHLPTTPRLFGRAKKGEILTYTDVVSPHSHTQVVMEKLFTFYRYGALGNWFDYDNLFDILNETGYHTVWISNQESIGGVNLGRIYAQRCSDYRFTTIDSADGIERHDEKIFPLLDEAMQVVASKNFYVIHLMGTHAYYRHRYPSQFSLFSLTDEKTSLPNDKRQTQAEYDNAVLYNDFIVDSIIRRFEDKVAMVIYVSDHGEDVYDENDSFSHFEEQGTKNMIEIPMLIWTSNAFREKYPALLHRMEEAVHRPFMTDDMIHAILDIMEIHTKEFDSKKSIFSPQFDAERKRIYHGKIYKKIDNVGALYDDRGGN